MVARLGRARTHHFAHFDSTFTCAPESYLHVLAKLTLATTYQRCVDSGTPFELRYPRDVLCLCDHSGDQPCSIRTDTAVYDLTRLFATVEVEGSVGGLRADVLVRSAHESLSFEIHVAHRVDEEKAEIGEKTIEFDIADENDVAMLEHAFVDIGDSRIRTHNIVFKSVREHVPPTECRKPTSAFVVFRNGKCRLFDRKPFSDIYTLKGVRDVEWLAADAGLGNYDQPRRFVSLVLSARERGLPVSNCHLCRYHTLNRKRGFVSPEVFCKWKKMQVKSNSAADCEAFKDDPKTYSNPRELG